MKPVFLAAVMLFLLAGTATAQSDWCWGLDDVVWAEVVGSTVRVHHDAAIYNCCPEAIIYDTSIQGSLIQIVETEVNPQCLCMCCFNLEVAVDEVPSGTWQVDFAWYNYESQVVEHRLLTVIVQAAGAGPPQQGNSLTSPCLTASGAPATPGESADWPQHMRPLVLLHPPAPNPTSGPSSIRFVLATPAQLRVAVFSSGGALVRTLADQAYVAGEHAVTWDGRDGQGRAVAAGVYLCRVEGPTTAALGRILVVR
jgi:hypothetical protein